ncbi:uncharacterized protein [Periplaneta americana]|uniref:uncharacterized protein n=1 Tax=Periplaneta americana TaxID=6978 RepID=UPI0037E9BD5A
MSSHQDPSTSSDAVILQNQMENAGFERDNRSTVEMGVVPAVNGNGVPGCTEMCLALHQQHQKTLQQYQKSSNPSPPESPWHPLKTVFLVVIIVLLIIWIVVYSVLSQLNML